MSLGQGEDGRWRDSDDTSNQIGHNSFEDAAAAQRAARGLSGSGGGDFISSMGVGGFVLIGAIFMIIMFWKVLVGMVAGFLAGVLVHRLLSSKISVFPSDFAGKFLAAAPNKVLGILLSIVRKILRGIENIILGLPAFVIVVMLLNVAFPDKADVRRQEEARYEAEMNASADAYALNVAPENGYPVKISRISYRNDATIITIANVKDGATDVFFQDTTGPESRYVDYLHNFGGRFTVTASSGTYESTKVQGAYDTGQKKYTGIEVLFPPAFTDSSFTMTETSEVSRPFQPPDKQGYQGPIENPLVFTNVTVKK